MSGQRASRGTAIAHRAREVKPAVAIEYAVVGPLQDLRLVDDEIDNGLQRANGHTRRRRFGEPHTDWPPRQSQDALS